VKQRLAIDKIVDVIACPPLHRPGGARTGVQEINFEPKIMARIRFEAVDPV
jgi:hypothetical protein